MVDILLVVEVTSGGGPLGVSILVRPDAEGLLTLPACLLADGLTARQSAQRLGGELLGFPGSWLDVVPAGRLLDHPDRLREGRRCLGLAFRCRVDGAFLSSLPAGYQLVDPWKLFGEGRGDQLHPDTLLVLTHTQER